MRLAIVLCVLALGACSEAPAPASPAADTGFGDAHDGGVDAMTDVPTYAADQFEHLEYSWYGTGVSENYAVDHDCGISGAPYGTGAPTKVGTIPEADCKGFATLAASPETISIMTGATECKFEVTDDYGKIALAIGGVSYLRDIGGCTDKPPFVHMKTELRRLYGLYATSPADAGAD